MTYNTRIITYFWIILFLISGGSVFLSPVLTEAQEPIQESGCLECHSDKGKLSDLSKEYITLLVPADFNEISIHKEISCVGCHADPGGYPHPEAMGIVQCSECHSTEYTDYLNSPHGTQSVATFQSNPKCSDCHALHRMRSSSDPMSRVHKNNEWATCTVCHKTEVMDILNIRLRTDDKSGNVTMAFTNGIHSNKIIENENINSLTCRDCHGFHSLSAELGAEWKDTYSTENKFCGECHTTEFRSFSNSIHSTVSISSVNEDVTLICSDCHIEHENADARFIRNEESGGLITNKCLACHLPVKITSQFALNARGYTEKIKSFHGIRKLHGNLTFQNCSSCHGIHEINSFAKESPEIAAVQISENCGRCHPDATADFTTTLVHLTATAASDDVNNVARIVMILLVYAAMSIILIIIFGDIYRAYRRKM